MTTLKKTIDRVRGELPAAFRGGLPDIRVERLQDVYVEGHRGLLSCSTERILLRTEKQPVFVDGENLKVCCITMEEVHIRGSIRAVGTVD